VRQLGGTNEVTVVIFAAKYKVWVISQLSLSCSGQASDQSITPPEWPCQHLQTKKNVGIIYKIENGYLVFDCIKNQVLHTVEHSSLINTSAELSRHIVITEIDRAPSPRD